MNYKEKSIWWKLTGPWYNMYNLIGDTIYYPKGKPPDTNILRHEQVHFEQIQKEGKLKFYLLYVLAFPILWNPWRYKWEYEAYLKGSWFTIDQIKKTLKSYQYGWLLNKGDSNASN